MASSAPSSLYRNFKYPPVAPSFLASSLGRSLQHPFSVQRHLCSFSLPNTIHHHSNTEASHTLRQRYLRHPLSQDQRFHVSRDRHFHCTGGNLQGFFKALSVSWKGSSKMPSVSANGDDAYSRAFNNNSTWRRSLKETEPELFERLGKGQAPQILWIGCADSRCPETTILGLQPGEIFCHRNIANIVIPTDINSLSVIQYAVQYLQVKHIIICGHTSCGGIAAALDNKKLGLIDTWLMPLRTLRRENMELLDSLDEKDKGLKMVELNVRSGVKVLLENPTVMDAIAERDLQVHGLIYNVGTGELREIDVSEDDDLVKSRKTAFRTA